jgi:hypothetical protein
MVNIKDSQRFASWAIKVLACRFVPTNKKDFPSRADDSK